MASDRRPLEGAPAEGRRLVGVLLQQRRVELGWTHRPAFVRARLPLTPLGNLNTRLVADLEEPYRDNFPESRLRQLAQAYMVTYESLIAVAYLQARVLAGTADALTPAVPAAPATPPASIPPMTDPARIAADVPYVNAINRRLRDLAGQGYADAPGALVFPGSPDDAKTWDGIGSRMSVDDRVWFVADLQRRADGRNGPGTATRTG